MQNIRLRSAVVSASFALLLAGCTGPPLLFERAGWSTPHAPGSVSGAATSPEAPAGAPAGTPAGMPALAPDDTPLLGWDGGVVDGARAGVREGDPGQGGIQPSSTGRMHIIELYQHVLDERDALRREVEALTAALERSQTTLAQMHEQEQRLEARVSELQEQTEALENENADLAARLTTAQIRRLEAEKVLLETRIEQLRALEGSAPESERAVRPVAAPIPKERR